MRSMVEGARLKRLACLEPPPPHFVRSPSPFRGGIQVAIASSLCRHSSGSGTGRLVSRST
jgi:hypothetical protein